MLLYHNTEDPVLNLDEFYIKESQVCCYVTSGELNKDPVHFPLSSKIYLQGGVAAGGGEVSSGGERDSHYIINALLKELVHSHSNWFCSAIVIINLSA